ncbi:MAG TPA: response regulator, partial [Steroidobacteraceae bacterium]|nr:response regulator [Steroidobacteraceae bacterium]
MTKTRIVRSNDARLLLVDDDPLAIQVMGRMLSQYPNQRFATSGEDALRLARELTPDLILLDAEMPGMTGFEVCDALKSDPDLAYVPVIFVTGHNNPAAKTAALRKGAADFIVKPLIAARLRTSVRVQLSNAPSAGLLVHLHSDTNAARSREPAPRILIVDDDDAAILMLRHTLSDMGGEFRFAKTGEDALQFARQFNPDLILLDAHMPGLDGFAVCAALKADPAFERLPIVFVTRFLDPDNERRALDLGAADFIAKPFTPAVLYARVRNLLELMHQTDAKVEAVRAHWRMVGDARVADIVEGASDAIVTYDADDKVVLANAAACQVFGVLHGKVIGLPVQALFGGEFQVPKRAFGKPDRITLFRGNGSQFLAEVSASRLGEDSELLTTVILRDVGDRERLEMELHARVAAESASHTKSLMMSYIAHEIGNPLTCLLGFAEIMATDVEHPLAPAQAERLEHILASGQQLEALMDETMELGKIEIDKLAIDLRPVEVAVCLKDAAAAVSALAQRAHVTLSTSPVSPSLRLNADADRLHQCLLNLLTNAIKYNWPGGWARIEVRGGPNAVAIAVSDNGIGMDATQRRHLFEPFNRLGRQQMASGSGLGLVITRQLVEAMNGQLRVESEPALG